MGFLKPLKKGHIWATSLTLPMMTCSWCRVQDLASRMARVLRTTGASLSSG